MSADRFYAKPAGKSPALSINVLGDKQLSELFTQLKNNQQKSVQISAFRQAAKPLLQDTKNNLSSRTRASKSGHLFKAIGVSPLRNLPILKIGVRRHGQFQGYHGHLIDAGTQERTYVHPKSGKTHRTGRVNATNFWTDAVEKNERGMVNSVQDQIIVAFHKLMVKYNNKAKT